MTTNSYFDSSFNALSEDQALYNDLIVESIQTHGRDFYYLPRTLTNFDEFFGEDSVSAFKHALLIELYLDNVEGWQGEGDFLSKFGLEIRDQATLSCSVTRFEQVITSQYPNITRPREGDVIVFPSTHDKRIRAFEISFVEKENPFYQLGRLYTYKITVRTFDYNGENFETGVDDIDNMNDYGITGEFGLSNVSNPDEFPLVYGDDVFNVGEVVTQTNGWSAIVLSFEPDRLVVTKQKGEFDPLLPITGESSGANRLTEDSRYPSEVVEDNFDTLYYDGVDEPAQGLLEPPKNTKDNTVTKEAGLFDETEYNPLTGA